MVCTRGVPGGKRSNRVKHIMFLPGDTNVHTGCTRCVPRAFFRRRRRFNDFRPLFLSKICQNLSKFVKKFVKICQNLSKFVKICQKTQVCTHGVRQVCKKCRHIMPHYVYQPEIAFFIGELKIFDEDDNF